MKKPRPAAPPPARPAAGLARSWEARVEEGAEGRVDAYVARAAAGTVSRSQLKARGAAISVNGKPAKPSRPVAPGDLVRVDWVEEASPGLVPEELPLAVLYEDGGAIVLDKAQGMVVHPGAGNRRGTLANALLWRLLAAGRDGTESASPSFRAGIVHRLDKDTSGVIVAAKDPVAQAFLAAQFKDRLARKEYLAITRGIPEPPEGRVADRLGRDRRDRKRFTRVEEGGKAALTEYRVLASWSVAGNGPGGAAAAPGKRGGCTGDALRGGSVGEGWGQAGGSGPGGGRGGAAAAPGARGSGPGGGRGGAAAALGQRAGYALVSLRPRTGRTHQLRVHLAGLGCPILGDPIYGKRDPRFPDATLMLHAHRLRITLPGQTEPQSFVAPVPSRFKVIARLLTAELGEPMKRGRKEEGAE